MNVMQTVLNKAAMLDTHLHHAQMNRAKFERFVLPLLIAMLFFTPVLGDAQGITGTLDIIDDLIIDTVIAPTGCPLGKAGLRIVQAFVGIGFLYVLIKWGFDQTKDAMGFGQGGGGGRGGIKSILTLLGVGLMLSLIVPISNILGGVGLLPADLALSQMCPGTFPYSI